MHFLAVRIALTQPIREKEFKVNIKTLTNKSIISVLNLIRGYMLQRKEEVMNSELKAKTNYSKMNYHSHAS